MIKNDLTINVHGDHFISGFADLDWKAQKLSEAKVGWFVRHSGNKFAFNFIPNFKIDGCPLANGLFDARLIYKANDRTEFGVGYSYRINKPETALRLGFNHVLSDGVTLKGRIDQKGHIDYAIKA